MRSNFEGPEGFASGPSERFRTALGERLASDLRDLVQKRVEKYYHEHIREADLNKAAERIFQLTIGGASEEETARAIDASATEILEQQSW